MAIAITLKEYLASHGAAYEVIPHRPTASSMETSAVAHVPGERVAKSVLLGDEMSYVMAILPATHRIRLDQLQEQLGRRLQLITEEELSDALADCEPGAVPPFGEAYGIDTVIEEGLMQQPDLYLEAGDHKSLIHMSGETFRDLMTKAKPAHFSTRV